MANWALGLMFLAMSGWVAGHKYKKDLNCGFPAIFSFGDDNADTGEYQAMFAGLDLPNGQTFFNESTGRYCDGRLIIDFIAQYLGFPLLSSYLNSYKPNFRNGANFALGDAVLGAPQTGVDFNLERQIFQLGLFTSRAMLLHQQLGGKRRSVKNILPKPEYFSKALYTIDIGQNDFLRHFQNSTLGDARKAITTIVNSFATGIYYLVKWNEAKFLWIHNVGPVGCLPYQVKSYLKKNPKGTLDRNGCVKEQNEVVQEFNTQLKKKISKLKETYPNATLTYVDVYSAKDKLISNAKKLGFKDPMKFCCGSYEKQYVKCGEKDKEGKLIGSACKDPSKYISWDGIHYTEAANQLLAKSIINGSLSDPPLPLLQACRRQSTSDDDDDDHNDDDNDDDGA